VKRLEDYILQMQQITKIYGNGIVANKDVDFNLKQGEIHALVGENGAGKSTLMKILFGMEKPSAGKILLSGKELNMNSSNDAIANGIGMVHQHFMLVETFTVAENITLGNEPKKGLFVNTAKAVKFTKELSEKYNLPIDPNAIVKDLPVGMRQKIEILKALARGARILILDEPTAVLTPQETDQLFIELLNLKNQGYTIVFISHKIREVKKISDRLTVMREGGHKGVFITAEVSEQEISNQIVGWEVNIELDKKSRKKGDIRVQVEHLSYYGSNDVLVLDDVSFSVRAGTILGVAGVQGNGQVELIELMTRARDIETGQIKVNGKDIAKLSVKQLRDTGCSYVPEDRMRQGVGADASIKENVISNQYNKPPYCQNGMIQQKPIDDFADRCISEYEIRCGSSATNLSMLSGGNMQKVVVARECSTNPAVLIAEQPTRGVDIGAAHIIHERILKLRDAGSAVLLISADLSEIMRLSDSLIVMYDGKIVAYFENPEQVSEQELGLCMLGSVKHDPKQIRRIVNG